MKTLIRLIMLSFLATANFFALSIAHGAEDDYVAKVWGEYAGPKIGIAILTFEDGLSASPGNNFFDGDLIKQVHYGFGEGFSNMLVITLLMVLTQRAVELGLAV